jgi:EAL domain-containing protein (putative c-di-GMP-specific phosphodiesterase class I)
MQSVIASGLTAEETFISIGLYEYNYKQSIAQLLSLSDNALSQAKTAQGHIHLDRAEDAVEVMGKDAWRTIINDAIGHNRFSVVSWNAVDAKTRKVAHKVLSISMKSSEGTNYSYGQYMASAIQIGLGPQIYKSVISMMFKTPDIQLRNTVCSLRLSAEYLLQEDTYDDLENLLKEHAQKLPFRLIIEVPDKLVRHKTEPIRAYKALFEKYNIELGLFEFIGEGGDYKYLQELRPVYIKGESSYFLSQSEQSLSALKLITDAIGISLIASGVMDEDGLKDLIKKEIHIVQGKAAELIELA